MRNPIIFTLGLILLLTSGCFIYRTPVAPPTAAVFSNYEGPVDINFNNTKIGDKRGEAQSVGVLGLLSFGDCSVDEAAQNGNIDRVDHIGFRFTNVLCIVTFYKTIVYGE